MKEPIEGKAKIDIAKEAVTSVLTEIPDDVPVGMRIYGSSYDPEASGPQNCMASRLLVPISTQGKKEIREKIGMLTPLGYTPIAYSMEQAAQDFADKRAQCSIILISDGKETCNGDPVAVAKSLKGQGYNMVVHTVGFDVDDVTRAQLKAIADAAGGMYMDASNAAALGSSLTAITQKIREDVVYEEQGEVSPGKGFTNATQIQLAQTYSHDVVVGEEHFYKVPVKKGEEISVAVTMKRKQVGPGWDASSSGNSKYSGPEADRGRNYGNPSSFVFTVSLFDSDQVLVSGGKQITLVGDKISPETVRYIASMPFSGEAYLSISLGWKYDVKPQMSPFAESIGTVWGEKKWQSLFSEARQKTDTSAYYTLKIRKAE